MIDFYKWVKFHNTFYLIKETFCTLTFQPIIMIIQFLPAECDCQILHILSGDLILANYYTTPKQIILVKILNTICDFPQNA